MVKVSSQLHHPFYDAATSYAKFNVTKVNVVRQKLLTLPEQPPCADYLGYPFQNQEGNNHAENLHSTYLMRRLPRKSTSGIIMSALFWNGYVIELVQVHKVS